jgi:hypothetical protein
MNKTFTFLIFFLLILTIFVLSRQPAGYRRELERRDEKYRTSLDSIKRVYRALEIRGSRMQERIDSLSNVTKTAFNKASQWKQRYDRQKRSYKPIPDPVLDSLINAYR